MLGRRTDGITRLWCRTPRALESNRRPSSHSLLRTTCNPSATTPLMRRQRRCAPSSSHRRKPPCRWQLPPAQSPRHKIHGPPPQPQPPCSRGHPVRTRHVAWTSSAPSTSPSRTTPTPTRSPEALIHRAAATPAPQARRCCRLPPLRQLQPAPPILTINNTAAIAAVTTARFTARCGGPS